MEINKNQFFREATLKICGSLDVATFLFESFTYIQNAIQLPAEFISITYITLDKSRLAMLAIASDHGGLIYKDDIAIPAIKKSYIDNPTSIPEVMIIDRLDEHPLGELWIAKGYENKIAQISLRLDIRGEVLAAVNFCAYGDNPFTKEHAEWIHLLKEPFTIAISNAIRHQQLLEYQEKLKEDNRFFQDELRQASGAEIIGANTGLKGVIELIRQVAPLASPVLLLGETGTGKELFASAIHHLSNRKEGPFIKVNCGAIPENLIDSELFGYEKGAFTGAFARKRGRFERADKGTLFLDEVGELRPDAQIRLLRVLQEKEIERVGGVEPVPIDVRIIAATHRNLKDLVREGRFREDLFFRLSVFPLAIPPLRDRKTDIPALVHYFIQNKCSEMGLRELPALAPGAYQHLMAYSWPGNVRELENAVERAIIIRKNNQLEFFDLQGPETAEDKNEKRPHDDSRPAIKNADFLSMDKLVSEHIRRTLQITNGKVHGKYGAAALLEMNPSTLRNKMKKLGIAFGRKYERTQI
jgi:transcriptional regulator with GAF, ATPase, and Fis domain